MYDTLYVCIQMYVQYIVLDQTLDRADGEQNLNCYTQSNAADYHCTLGWVYAHNNIAINVCMWLYNNLYNICMIMASSYVASYIHMLA